MAKVRRRPRLTRDVVLLVSGLGLALYEAVWAAKVEQSLVYLVIAWTLSPLALRVDEAIGAAKTRVAKVAPDRDVP